MDWINHVKEYSNSHGISYKAALTEARSTYQKKTGAGMKSKQLHKFLNETYEKNGKNIEGYEIDPHLSGRRVKVWHNPESGKTIVGHRGTDPRLIPDLITDAAMSVGIENTARFRHSKNIQKKAKQKYGTDNMMTIGHSLGSRLAEKFGKDSEIITLNKPVTLKTIGKIVPDNQYDIRSSGDLISALAHTQQNPNLHTIQKQNKNPLVEHSVDILQRVPDIYIGKGIKIKKGRK